MDAIANHQLSETKKRKPAFFIYIWVWLSLLVLTGLTVFAAQLPFKDFAIVVCLAIAAMKTTIVLFFFMHLRHEKRLLLKLLIPIVIVVLVIIIGLTYIDIVTR